MQNQNPASFAIIESDHDNTAGVKAY